MLKGNLSLIVPLSEPLALGDIFIVKEIILVIILPNCFAWKENTGKVTVFVSGNDGRLLNVEWLSHANE